MDELEKYIREAAENRKIGIFGTGKLSYVAEDLLEKLGVTNYVFLDNDLEKQKKGWYHNKTVFSPERITKDWLVLISTRYFSEIKSTLEKLGLKETEHYIYVLEPEYYEAILKHHEAPRVPNINLRILKGIEQELKQYVIVKEIDFYDELEFEIFEEKLGFGDAYQKAVNRRYRRKIMEYYIVSKLLDFDHWSGKDIYLDIGACSSPFAKYLREVKEVKAYGVDLERGPYDKLGYYLQEDATKMHFKEKTIRAISMQSAFEMFAGDADIRFISEAARVLENGGQVIILPLYMHERYLTTVSPNYYHKGMADAKSEECIRTDCRMGIPMARFYSVEALYERIVTEATKVGLKVEILSLPDEIVEIDEFVYLKFVLRLIKDKRILTGDSRCSI